MSYKQKPTAAARRDRKATGAHYTPRILADFVAQVLLDAWADHKQASAVRLLDPAVGDGELLLALVREACKRHLTTLQVHGFDTDCQAICNTEEQLAQAFPLLQPTLICTDFLQYVLNSYSVHNQGGLFTPASPPPYDWVIANPPYVRTQVLGARQAQRLAQQFQLIGRADLYYAFIKGIAQVLRPDGIAGIIVSNRFMTTKSGAAVRRSITEEFDILHVWDLGDTALFEAAVLPAVLLLRKKNGPAKPTTAKFTSIYMTKTQSPETHSENIITALERTGTVCVNYDKTYLVRHGVLDQGDHFGDVWRIATDTSNQWLATVSAHTYCTFGQIGKVRVGVKTTADKVFIRSDWDSLPKAEQPELLKPILTHHMARRFKANPSEQQILYTHTSVQGTRVAINLQEFPRTARYLNRHRSILESRKYVVQAGRHWYEIWVPQNPDVWVRPKLVFCDIAEAPVFWIDLTGAVVNGDCYWLTVAHLDSEPLLWLAVAVGNSSFIESFYDHRFHNKLYSGRRRFMTQYVEEFPLPSPKTPLAQEIIRISKLLYDLIPSPRAEALEKTLDELVWRAFGLTVEERAR